MYTHFTVGRLHDLFQMIRCKRLFQPIEDRAAVIFGGMFLAVFQQTECDFINRNPVSFIMNEKCKKFFCFPALEGDWGFIYKQFKIREAADMRETVGVHLCIPLFSCCIWRGMAMIFCAKTGFSLNRCSRCNRFSRGGMVFEDSV